MQDDKLREALERRDAKYSVCPYSKGIPPLSTKACKVCHADRSEPCRKRVIADAEFVDDVRAALATSPVVPMGDAEIDRVARIFTRSVYDHLGKGRIGHTTAWEEMHQRFKDQLYPLVVRALSTPTADETARLREAITQPLSPAWRDILGLMCFQLGGPAHAYQKAGEFVGADGPLTKRAEDEQAFMLHKLLGFWLAHGDAWTTAAQADLDRVRAALTGDPS